MKRLVTTLTPFLLLGACSGPRLRPSPDEGGNDWFEIKSANFTLQTNLTLDDARATALYLERTRSAFVAFYKYATIRQERVRVFAMRDDGEFRDLLGWTGGLFTRDSFGPLILTAGRPGDSGRAAWLGGPVLKHELAHEFTSHLVINQPRWLSEGLATYLETMEISDGGKTATFGHANIHMQRFTRMTVADTINPRLWVRECIDCYPASWWLVHWLMNQKADQFQSLIDHLNRGESAETAWNNVFAGLSDLDDELRVYRESGRYTTFKVSLPTVANEVAERKLGDADVHALRALMLLRNPRGMGGEPTPALRAARREVDEALRKDSSGLLSLYLMSGLQPSRRMEFAERAVAAHPDRAEAWVMMEAALPPGAAKREEALKTAVGLDSTNVSALQRLALLYAQRKTYLRALPLARDALQLAPRNSEVWDTYAQVAFGLNNCSEAISAENRAIESLHGRLVNVKLYEDHLAAYKQECSQELPTSKQESK